jgi:hypothetical protein
MFFFKQYGTVGRASPKSALACPRGLGCESRPTARVGSASQPWSVSLKHSSALCSAFLDNQPGCGWAAVVPAQCGAAAALFVFGGMSKRA